jgi:hypothetical protein
MKSFARKALLLGASVFVAANFSKAALADPLPTPAMAGPLAANANPFSIDLPDWLGDAGGKVYVGGAVTGLGYVQSNATHGAPGDADSYIDLSNGQVFIQKTDGWLQFYVQAGEYSFPTVGVPYTRSSTATTANFGVVPVAYLKLQGEGSLSEFSLQGGKLPTLIGDEYVFTFENMNVERGLLWNIEPAVSTGIQGNWTHGPLTISLSWNDGTYAKKWNWISGLISYAVTPTDTVVFSGGGNLGNPNFSFLNSGSVYTLIWTHTEGNWVISPYIQYNETPKVFLAKGSSVIGGALLASYSFNDNWKLAGRIEYESETGTKGVFTTPDILGYGPGSNAVSVTLTPTYQWKQLFARVDASYVSVGNLSGAGFGTTGTQSDQFRGMLELGVLF